jgi:hypothetical protein
MEMISEIHHRSRSLPQVVSKDRQTGPDNGFCRARVYWHFYFLFQAQSIGKISIV